MLGLRILRLVLPAFHSFKYKYIEWYFGKQNNKGGWKTKYQFKIIKI